MAALEKIEIGGVFIIEVSGIVPSRDVKAGVCICISGNKYLLINTKHRDMYDDFSIEGYGFLKGEKRYIACSNSFTIPLGRIKQRVGTLDFKDMMSIIDKIKKSKRLSKADKAVLLPELENWYYDNI